MRFGMKLLLAEDERELSDALVAILKHGNYAVDAVYNGIDALDYILVGDYDGVILDVMMPGMDGFTVVKKLREKGDQTPVLILTAKGEVDDRVTGLDSGADDYLTKPFAMKELLARVRSITRRRTEAASSVIRLGNVELDCAAFTISCGQELQHLTGKEFQMLQLFMSYPAQVFSAEKHLFSLSEAVNETVKLFYPVAESRKRTLAAQIEDGIDINGDEKSIRQMFERFYRADASRNSATGGSGIGLAVVRSVAEAHQASIHAESPDGTSLRIRIEFTR